MTIPAVIPDRVLVTGGAGFIGSHLVDALLDGGRTVTILDDLSTGDPRRLADFERRGARTVIGGLTDPEAVTSAVAGAGMVWHLAGNADIPGGVEDTRVDLEAAVIGTRVLLEAMREHEVAEIVFTSSGSVYGDLARSAVAETAGPLIPLSLYAAGKISAESFIGGYAHLFGLRAWIFRLGNVLGARMCRGAIRDFALRLAQAPEVLTVLGDGRQTKNYFLVEDCLDAMFTVCEQVRPDEHRPCVLLNLGNTGSTPVTTIARSVAAAMGRPDIPLEFTGGEYGWLGDQPVVHLDVSALHALGWKAAHDSDQAVAEAARRMVDFLGLV
ncbi:NAD-dependent epimerase/dehydratase family protein [Nocardia takedensis]